MSTPRRHLTAALCALSLAASAFAGDWSPRLSAGSDFPVAISVRGALQTPYRLELGASLGTLPGAYADAINGVAVSAGAYDDETAQIIRESLRSSLVLSTFAELRVVSRLRAHTNYTLVTLGGTTTTADQTATVGGVPLPIGQEGRQVDIASTLHMFGVGVSWPIGLTPALQMRLGLGARFTVAAQTTVDSSGNSSREEEYERAAERRLNDIYTSYAHTPVLSLHFDYSF